MDVETVDREYQQLEQEAQLVGQSIQAFAEKLQTAGDAGDANAKSWVLDLKSLALQIQQEQLQVQSLLQALHEFAVNSMQAQPTAAGTERRGRCRSRRCSPNRSRRPRHSPTRGVGCCIVSSAATWVKRSPRVRDWVLVSGLRIR